MSFGFDSPLVLVSLILIPFLYIAYRRFIQKRKKDAMKFSNISFIKSALGDRKKSRRHEMVFYLMLSVVSLMIIGFADPHIPLMQTKEGVNVVLVIDVSGSMKATDYSPSRIEAAKSSAEVLINSLESKDDVGIVTFSSGATTSAYLSPYKERVVNKLRSIAATDGSTAIGDGLSSGIDMATSLPNKKKVVILLSDGVNNAGIISPDEAVAFSRSNKVQVYTIGMGSNGNVLLGYDWFGNPQYAELDEKTLMGIAQGTGGKYFKSVDPTTLKEIYQNISVDITRENEDTNIKDWFFLSALAVMIFVMYLQYGPKRVIQ
jgi:Ca-activated chloride channel homolog